VSDFSIISSVSSSSSEILAAVDVDEEAGGEGCAAVGLRKNLERWRKKKSEKCG
jgi:acetylornithine deacetylase/succinyl-diaminopimelate desuccinylase-like protein